MIIRQLPGGGLYTGTVGALVSGAERDELMGEMQRMYLARIYGRARAAGVPAPRRPAARSPHPPFTGTHHHGHSGYGHDSADDDGMHSHPHTHDNDADHDHEGAHMLIAPYGAGAPVTPPGAGSYAKHIRFEHGGVREVPVRARARDPLQEIGMNWPELAAALREGLR